MDVARLRAEVRSCLADGNAPEAWARIAPHASALVDDAGLAQLWLELLAETPDRPTLRSEAERVLGRWPEEPGLVLAANRALIAAAELRPLDEPPLREDGPAHVAAAAAERCLAALAQGTPAEVRARLWNTRANALRLAGPAHDGAAQQAFGEALALQPGDGGSWFDLGLLHKWRGRFREGLDCNLRARSRLGETRAVLWNAAICATALGEGDLAAGFWQRLGMPAELHPKSGMPFVDGLPSLQVRVLSRGAGVGPRSALPDRATGFEVLWVAPLSPCHGVVQTPSFRDAPIDYGDVVLWDGAPVAIEATDAGPVPRFPLLEILRRGDERRFRFVALQRRQGAVETVEGALPEGCRLFTQRERVEHLCPACADGAGDARHEHLPAEEHRLTYGKLVVPAQVELAALRRALEGAVGKGAEVVMALPELYERLGDTKRAGQEHQSWRGIERRASKRGLAEAP